jgi:uncharacterized protein
MAGMQRRDDRFLFSPSDLGNFLACEHLTQLDLGLALRGGRRPSYENAYAELLRTKGAEHEQAFLESLRATGRQVVEVRLNTARDFEDGTRRTAEAMRAGADYVYQAVFLSEGWRGIADFLERVDRPSALGDWSYQVLDTKLARHPRPEHALQLSFYSQALADTQELAPDLAYVVLGTRERVAIRLADVTAYFRRVRERFGTAVGIRPATGPYPCHHCSFCDYRKPCDDQLEREDHIVRVAGIQRTQVKRCFVAGVDTLAALAQTPAGTVVPRIAASTFEALREQAGLQLIRQRTGSLEWRALDAEAGRGFAALPPRSPGDVIFDLEGHPFFEPARGLEYLFGVLLLDGPEPRYQPFWAHDRDGERRAFESLVDLIHARLAEYPDLHVYHFSGSEQSTLKRLMAEYVSREAQVDDLLRRKVFVDLHTILRRALRAGVSSYSLKDVEALFGFIRSGPVQSGTQAILHYERWIRRLDETLLDEIAAYNREDCPRHPGPARVAARDPPRDLPWPEPPEAQPAVPRRPPRPSMRAGDCARRSSREPSPGHRGGSRASCSSITGAKLVHSGGPTTTAWASRRKSCRRTRRPSPIWRSITARPLGRSSARSFIRSRSRSRTTSSGPDFRCTIPRPPSPPGKSSRSTIRVAPSASCVCNGVRRWARVPCRKRSWRVAPSRRGRRARPSCAWAKRSAPAMGVTWPSGPSSPGSGPPSAGSLRVRRSRPPTWKR